MADESGTIVEVVSGSGMYMWYISYILLFISLFIPAKWKRDKSKIRELNFPQDPEKIY